MSKKQVSKATSLRYPLYLKALAKLKEEGKTRIISKELAEILNLTASTVRHDFTFLFPSKELGRQGSGYPVDALIETLTERLGLDNYEPIVLVGVGNFGKALLKYNQWNNTTGKINAAFDANPDLVGIINDIPVYDIKELRERFPNNCRVAILTISQNVQETVNTLQDLGIKGFIDFTREHFEVKPDVQVRTVDVVSTMQGLIAYLDDHNK